MVFPLIRGVVPRKTREYCGAGRETQEMVLLLDQCLTPNEFSHRYPEQPDPTLLITRPQLSDTVFIQEGEIRFSIREKASVALILPCPSTK